MISTVRTYLRAVLPIRECNGLTVVSTGFLVLTPGPDIDARYLGWLVQSDTVVEEVVARSVGVGYPAISPSDVPISECLRPLSPRQQAIAEFLDDQVTRILDLDRAHSDLWTRINERLDTQLKWLVGESELARADGHRSVPLRRVLRKLERPATSGEMVTAFRDGQVTRRSSRRPDGFTDAWIEGSALQLVAAGDVVVHGLYGFAGAIGTAEQAGVCSPVYHVCEPIEGDPEFWGRLLRLLAVEGYLGQFATSTRERAVDFRNWDLFGAIPVPQVDAVEQRQIGAEIRRLQPLRDLVRRSEALLKERRQALITAAVTGQLHIPGAT